MFTVLLGIVVLLLSVAIAVAGLGLAQRMVPLERRESHNVAIGIIYGALYIMFGVLVGFSSYLVLTKYSASQNTVTLEANAVAEVHRLSGQLPEPQRARFQELATSYARVVIDEEWPLMREGASSSRAESLFNQLATEIESYEASTTPEQALVTQMLERVHDLSQNRESRLLDTREGLPPILWVVLMILGVAIVLFTYFLGMESTRLHRLAVAMLTAGIAFVVFTIIALDHPFGDLRVSPETFELALDKIERHTEQEP